MKDETLQVLTVELPIKNALVGTMLRANGVAIPRYPNEELIIEANRDLYPPRDAEGRWSIVDDMTSMMHAGGVYITAYIRNPMQRTPVWIWLRRYEVVPTIGYPAQDASFLQNTVIDVTGTALTGSMVSVIDASGRTLATAVPGAYGMWTTKITLPSRLGTFEIRAKQQAEGGTPDPSLVRNVLLMASAPNIMTPASNTTQNQTFKLTGTGATGATIEILEDLAGDEVIASDTVKSDGKWDVDVSVPPGKVSLVAEQVFQGHRSGRSTSRLYNIRPSPLLVTATQFETGVQFNGHGYETAIVEITKISGPGTPQIPPATVANGTWEILATNWVEGTYKLSAIQKIDDNAGGWISSLRYEFELIKSLPALPLPSEVKYTVSNYTVSFSGEGTNGATVVLLNDGGGAQALPSAPVVNGVWSSMAATAWGPTFKRNVHLTQTRNSQVSVGWLTEVVTIAPEAPVITSVVEIGDSPSISGTCWPGAVVKLVFSDCLEVHEPSGSTGSWTFKRDAGFASGVEHSVDVTQEAASQTSPSATAKFYAQTPAPIITAKGSEIERDVEISGTGGVMGATLTLFDAQFGRPLGNPVTLLKAGDWTVSLFALEFRLYNIHAVQVIGGRASVASNRVDVTVVLGAPKFSVPASGQRCPRTFLMKGTGMPLGRVTVWQEGNTQPLRKDVEVSPEGSWEARVTLPVHQAKIYGKQDFENQESKSSERVTFTVVPDKPFFETPAEGEGVGRQVTASGFGFAGDRIALAYADAPLAELGHTTVHENLTWSFMLQLERPGGAQKLIAVQSRDEFKSDPSPSRAIVLNTFQPRIDHPAEGEWVSDPIVFVGTGKAGDGELVDGFNPERRLAQGILVTAQGWQQNVHTQLSVGGQWVSFRQTITGESTGSDWAESQRFEVRAQPFLSEQPVIDSLTCERPVTYEGYVTNAKVRVIRKSDSVPLKELQISWHYAGHPLQGTLTDAEGFAAVTFMTAQTGEHDLVATQSSGAPGSKSLRIQVLPLKLARVSVLAATPSTFRVGQSTSIEARVVTLWGSGPIEGRKVEWLRDAEIEPFATTYTASDGKTSISFAGVRAGSTDITAQVQHAEGAGPSSRAVTLTILA